MLCKHRTSCLGKIGTTTFAEIINYCLLEWGVAMLVGAGSVLVQPPLLDCCSCLELAVQGLRRWRRRWMVEGPCCFAAGTCQETWERRWTWTGVGQVPGDRIIMVTGTSKYTLTHSLTHSLTHTHTHTLTHTLSHSLTHTHSLTHSLTHSHTHSLTHTH